MGACASIRSVIVASNRVVPLDETGECEGEHQQHHNNQKHEEMPMLVVDDLARLHQQQQQECDADTLATLSPSPLAPILDSADILTPMMLTPPILTEASSWLTETTTMTPSSEEGLTLSTLLHTFGTHPLTCEELRTLLPPSCATSTTHRATPLTSRSSKAFWSSSALLNNPLLYSQTHTEEWNRQLIEYGIPSQLRLKVWKSVLEVGEDEERELMERMYCDYLHQPSPADDQIRRDIYRTYSSHSFFSLTSIQHTLARILHAWSLYYPSVSYVQGHNMIVACLLYVTLDEQLTFRLFVKYMTHEKKGMKRYYEDGLHHLLNECENLSSIIQSRHPKLSSHFSKYNLETVMYATPFFLTAFTQHLELDTAVGVLDWVLCAELEEYELPRIEREKEEITISTPTVTNTPSTSSIIAASPSTTVDIIDLTPSPPLSFALNRTQTKNAWMTPSLLTTTSTHTPSIAHNITHLTLSLLSHQESSLLSRSTPESIFQEIQSLDLLKKDKGRKKAMQKILEEGKKRKRQGRNEE